MPIKFAAEDILNFFWENDLTFHVNHYLADDSHEMSNIIYFEKNQKRKGIRLLSAAVVIHTLRVDMFAKSGLSMPLSLPEIITICISLCKAMRKVMVELDEELVPRLTFKVPVRTAAVDILIYSCIFCIIFFRKN